MYAFQNHVETCTSTFVTWSWKPAWISKKINVIYTHTQKGCGQERHMHPDKRAFHNKTEPLCIYAFMMYIPEVGYLVSVVDPCQWAVSGCSHLGGGISCCLFLPILPKLCLDQRNTLTSLWASPVWGSLCCFFGLRLGVFDMTVSRSACMFPQDFTF